MHFIRSNNLTLLCLVVALASILQTIPGTEANLVLDIIVNEGYLLCPPFTTIPCKMAIQAIATAFKVYCHHGSKLYDPNYATAIEAQDN